MVNRVFQHALPRKQKEINGYKKKQCVYQHLLFTHKPYLDT
jgi:hypothetical protein